MYTFYSHSQKRESFTISFKITHLLQTCFLPSLLHTFENVIHRKRADFSLQPPSPRFYYVLDHLCILNTYVANITEHALLFSSFVTAKIRTCQKHAAALRKPLSILQAEHP